MYLICSPCLYLMVYVQLVTFGIMTNNHVSNQSSPHLIMFSIDGISVNKWRMYLIILSHIEPSAKNALSIRLFSQQNVHTARFCQSVCLTSDPPESLPGPRLASIGSLDYQGVQPRKQARLPGWGGRCWAGPSVTGQRMMVYLLFVSGTILFSKCAVATGQRSPSIRHALSLSPRSICKINKGEGLRPGSCFDFIIYILFIFYPHTTSMFCWSGWVFVDKRRSCFNHGVFSED